MGEDPRDPQQGHVRKAAWQGGRAPLQGGARCVGGYVRGLWGRVHGASRARLCVVDTAHHHHPPPGLRRPQGRRGQDG